MSEENRQQQSSAESTVAGAAKTGKAIASIAKGAATGGAHGAAVEAAKSSKKWIIPIVAVILLPVLIIAMLPSVIFGSLFGDGTDTPNGISDDTVLVQNLADINSGISMILSEGLNDVLARIDSDFAASGCDSKEVNNPFGSDVVFNANAIVSQYCAYKDTDATSISKDDMESLLAANKDKLYSFTYTDEVREVPSEPEAESTETVAPDTTTEEPPEPTYETIRVYTIYGVKFVLYDSGKNPIGEYTTDQDGYIYIDDELVPGKYYLRELEAADGYIRDEQYKTVYVERGKCAQIEWENSAVTGQIQIRKYSSEDNTVTGQLAGTPLEGAVFEITQARSGKVVGYIVTDARGVAASGPLPLGRYFVTEVSAPKYYQLSGEKMEAEIEYPSQIIKLSAYNKPATLGVTIKKSGNYEVQSGQTMSYDFSGIANTSNVVLNHFFWHDRIPTDATRALSISTGTYNARLYYKVTFKTNLNDYRTLASNLLTSNNYSLSLNAATLRLVQGEYVTDVRFEFGTVPSGFSSVVKPTMRVQVLGTVSNGYQIINRADVGGQYLNEWQTAKTTWVTTVRRFNTTPLPKTGY